MRAARSGRSAVAAARAGSVAAAVLAALLAVAPAWGADGPPPAPAPAVLASIDPAATAGPVPTAAGVADEIGALVRQRLGDASVLVVDPGRGTVLYERTADRARTPASTTKIPTAVAALTLLDPQGRLATVAYRADDTVYLVGGGDPTLVRARGGNPLAGGSASLRDLAGQVASAVGSGEVRVVYDDSAFRGPALGPGWPTSFPAAGVVAPVSALVVDSGRVRPGAAARVGDPARQAGQVFAGFLRDQGVPVASVGKGRRPASAQEVGRVESPPIADIVQRMLTESDNDYAEALAHLAGGALLDKPTFAGGAAATAQALTTLGVDTDGLHLVDGSGLSGRDRIPATLLGEVLTDVALGTHPVLGTVAAGLPVAGFTGTLADRYVSAATRPGRGFVHAKTGTLTGVVALAGTVQDADGRVLVFAMLADDVASIPATRETMDVIASRLATCGCSG